MNVIPAFLEKQSLILIGINYDHVGGAAWASRRGRPHPMYAVNKGEVRTDCKPRVNNSLFRVNGFKDSK
jgi:hypothetical protein